MSVRRASLANLTLTRYKKCLITLVYILTMLSILAILSGEKSDNEKPIWMIRGVRVYVVNLETYRVFQHSHTTAGSDSCSIITYVSLLIIFVSPVAGARHVDVCIDLL